ncbi:MAG TPA: DinB family protein [Phycisphaerae bacterium]|nr:DinB family protein [Phycisphaerae bacterium]
MADRIPWIERTFDFGFPVQLHHEMLERLRGTPARIEERVRGLPPDVLTQRPASGPWSIQENVGHLLNVEALFLGRLDDYDAGVEVLRPADMSNRKTHEAKHNERPIESILTAFRQERGKLVGRLEQLDPDRFGQTIHHPRLDKPMRIVDMMYFLAEHDDYHLARVTELLAELAE